MQEYSNKSLLVVEDSDEDFEALKRIMNKAQINTPIYRCCDGEDALDFLYRQGEYKDPNLAPRPSLIVLDLNLPGTDGREVLTELKQDEKLKTIPILVFSTSSNPKDIDACYCQGVNSYIIKPMDIIKLNRLIQVFLNYWLEIVELPRNN